MARHMRRVKFLADDVKRSMQVPRAAPHAVSSRREERQALPPPLQRCSTPPLLTPVTAWRSSRLIRRAPSDRDSTLQQASFPSELKPQIPLHILFDAAVKAAGGSCLQIAKWFVAFA